MLKIRVAQLAALEEAQVRELVRAAVARLREEQPERFATLGQAAATEVVETAMHRAIGYGIVDADDLLVYASLAFRLGEQFDTDPQYPWAQETLADRERDPHARMLVLAAWAAGPPEDLA